MSGLKILSDYTSKIVTQFFSSDLNLVSKDFTEIMANNKDKESYLNAVKQAREKKEEQKVKLSTGEILVVAP